MVEMSYCPLNLKGVQAGVASEGNAFAVEVTSEDPAVAREIIARARAIVSPPISQAR
jgi:hypothetical protein